MEPHYDPVTHSPISQFRALLSENAVPWPHILWTDGKGLLAFLRYIQRDPDPKDQPIIHRQLYRYNLDTGRARRVEPRLEGRP